MIATVSEVQACDGAANLGATCRTLALSRSTWYRVSNQPAWIDPDVDLRDQIQRLSLKSSSGGYRRITEALHRLGFNVNHKRVLRIMREDNLLWLRKHRFINTTDSNHGLLIYPNLARDTKPTGINQLWVSDITYIRLQGEFIYLAVVLDVFSRRVIGWELSRRIDTQLVVNALKMALKSREVKSGLIHHSDRGVQYASKEYTDLLKEYGITISMSRKGNPYDNAFAESFMKTLKYEEVYLSDYQNLTDARRCVGRFLEQVYNQERLHSRIGYVPPEEFEASLVKQ